MLRKISPEDIPVGRGVKIPKLKEDLIYFADTTEAATEFIVPKGCTPKGVWQASYRMIRKLDLPLNVIQRGDRIFWIRKEEAAPGAATPKGGKGK